MRNGLRSKTHSLRTKGNPDVKRLSFVRTVSSEEDRRMVRGESIRLRLKAIDWLSLGRVAYTEFEEPR